MTQSDRIGWIDTTRPYNFSVDRLIADTAVQQLAPFEVTFWNRAGTGIMGYCYTAGQALDRAEQALSAGLKVAVHRNGRLLWPRP